MKHKSLCILPTLLMVAGTSAQVSNADQHVERLIERWRWKQYWQGTTELRTMYIPGRRFRALLFWRKDENPPSVGFCSIDLGICQFYPNAPGNEHSFETKITSGTDIQSAFRRFQEDSFGEEGAIAKLSKIERPPEVGRAPEPQRTDYSTEMVTIILPRLDPPDAIRSRKPQPSADTDALIANLSCLPDQPPCKVHLMVPFYSRSDPNVPVFRQCSACPNPKPMIIFMKLIEGNWWHGAMDFDDRPDVVDRTRKQIENALMLEVKR